MKTKKIILSKEQEISIRRQADEVVRQVRCGAVAFDFASPRLQAIIVGSESVEKRQDKKNDLAEERRVWVENWLRGLGLTVSVPKPDISNREFDRRAKIGQELFYRPSTGDLSYDAFMKAVGQSDHWTVVVDDRHKIKWEEVAQGYWFWAEISENCPRTNTSWNNLSASIHLLSLEEYVLVWHAYKAQTEKLIDQSTWAWVRTRYQISENDQGALGVGECGGVVRVGGWLPGDLSVPGPGGGGRLAEVVKSSAT